MIGNIYISRGTVVFFSSHPAAYSGVVGSFNASYFYYYNKDEGDWFEPHHVFLLTIGG